ncbi:MAG TPA: thioredoxin family protein [Verrucomicrobiae bacterium]
MRRTILAVVVFLLGNFSLPAAHWSTDYNAALKAAQVHKRPVLINFTGSDWCGWCIRLKNEVFNTPEFDEFAKSRLVLVEVDFPNRKPQSAALQQANQALQEKYRVTGYPTLFLVDGSGKVLQQLGYMEGGPKVFIEQLLKTMPAAPPAPPKTNTVVAAHLPASKGPVDKSVYDKLALKGISGTAKPVALINNKAFTTGDSFKLHLGTASVQVTCVSISADHVMIRVDGETEPRKLVLGAK